MSGRKSADLGGMAEGLRAAVHDYVKHVNQAEIELKADGLTGIVSDCDYLARTGRRLSRLEERDRLRGAYPERHESRARLLHIGATERDGEVPVRLELHFKRTLAQRGAGYAEERLETERLWLAEANGRWQIARIEPEIAERRSGASGDPETEDVPQENGRFQPPQAVKSVSVPYLNDDLLPYFNQHRPSIPYRRDLAAAYADRWWQQPNPAYENMQVNCTNYVSQCLFAGHAPMNYTGKRASGWWYKGRSGGQELWSYSWAVADALQRYLSAARAGGLRATPVDAPWQLKLGDVICYDWEGDGRYGHNTIVTAFDREGMPLVNANTVSSRHRYWDYRDSYAWTPRTRYRFFHIADLF
ncbi:amidase domain-containing protein [uncultured Paenibacillus sp.]|uniref:amidase domain-containing protein n=1 Tax=uncultured Paenibacillus sp. TaxID=227322 RepID=UPI0028D17A47|nr:amidase domain-containing protein [uncultured Paenibacillus sp.]